MTTKNREFLRQQVTQLTDILSSLTQSYRLMIGGAEEFNRITLASRDDVDDAIDRADSVGNIIDEVLIALEVKMKLFLSAPD